HTRFKCDWSSDVCSSDLIGLFGPNGSGKSTLLRLIAGVYPATSGRIEVRGRVMPLLGLSAGANLDLVATDNISLLLRIGGRRPRSEEPRVGHDDVVAGGS